MAENNIAVRFADWLGRKYQTNENIGVKVWVKKGGGLPKSSKELFSVFKSENRIS